MSLGYRIPIDEKRTIVFFDGVCGLCNSIVDRLINLDREQVLYYSPLQGETSLQWNIHTGEVEPDTIKVLYNGTIYEKSDAVISLLKVLGKPYSLLRIFAVLPRSFRDYMYDTVAKHRYRMFGKKESCRLPTPDERKFFLP